MNKRVAFVVIARDPSRVQGAKYVLGFSGPTPGPLLAMPTMSKAATARTTFEDVVFKRPGEYELQLWVNWDGPVDEEIGRITFAVEVASAPPRAPAPEAAPIDAGTSAAPAPSAATGAGGTVASNPSPVGNGVAPSNIDPEPQGMEWPWWAALAALMVAALVWSVRRTRRRRASRRLSPPHAFLASSTAQVLAATTTLEWHVVAALARAPAELSAQRLHVERAEGSR